MRACKKGKRIIISCQGKIERETTRQKRAKSACIYDANTEAHDTEEKSRTFVSKGLEMGAF